MSNAQYQNEALKKFQTLSESILSNLEYKEGSVQEVVKHQAYNQNLPEGVTPDTVAAIGRYNAEFVTASHIAVASIAADVFKKEKDVNVVTGEVNFFNEGSTVGITAHREKSFNPIRAKDAEPGEPIVHKLWLATDVKIKGTKGVNLENVRKAISSEFAGTFSS